MSWHVWQLKAIEIGVGRKHKFGLTTLTGTHPAVLWVHRQADVGISAMTAQAVTTGNERENDTLLNALHRLAELIDDTHGLMTNNRAFLESGAAVVHMQVASA